MSITLSEAIAQLRREIGKAILERPSDGIVFLPKEVEVELGITFETEAKAGGGFKLLALVDLNGETRASRSSQNKIKMKLQIVDHDMKPLKIRSTDETDA